MHVVFCEYKKRKEGRKEARKKEAGMEGGREGQEENKGGRGRKRRDCCKGWK